MNKTPLPGEPRVYRAPLPDWFDRALKAVGEEFGLGFQVDGELQADGTYGELTLEPRRDDVFSRLVIEVVPAPNSTFDGLRFVGTDAPTNFRNSPRGGMVECDSHMLTATQWRRSIYTFSGSWRNCTEFLEDVFFTLFESLLPFSNGKIRVGVWYSGGDTVPKSIENLGLA